MQVSDRDGDDFVGRAAEEPPNDGLERIEPFAAEEVAAAVIGPAEVGAESSPQQLEKLDAVIAGDPEIPLELCVRGDASSRHPGKVGDEVGDVVASRRAFGTVHPDSPGRHDAHSLPAVCDERTYAASGPRQAITNLRIGARTPSSSVV